MKIILTTIILIFILSIFIVGNYITEEKAKNGVNYFGIMEDYYRSLDPNITLEGTYSFLDPNITLEGTYSFAIGNDSYIIGEYLFDEETGVFYDEVVEYYSKIEGTSNIIIGCELLSNRSGSQTTYRPRYR